MMTDPQITTIQRDSAAAPTATIVVCVFNRPDDVVRCLESIRQLAAADWEVVVVDDCSTDTTPSVLSRFCTEHPEMPIRIVRNRENLGVSGARNSGIDSASGQFVFFTDSDCTVAPQWLTAHLEALRDQDISAVAGRVQDDPPRNWAERAQYGVCCIAEHEWQGRDLIGGNMGFRREILKEYGFDEALTYGCDEDDIARRMANDGHRFAFVPDAVVYHHHPFTISGYIALAWKQGKGSAHFWWKHRIYLGRDVVILVTAFLLLPCAVFWKPMLYVTMLMLLAQIAALVFNETRLKRKTVFEALIVLPIVLVANLVKTLSVIHSCVMLRSWGRTNTELAPHEP